MQVKPDRLSTITTIAFQKRVLKCGNKPVSVGEYETVNSQTLTG
jgi:hypothetical protein